ncbi:MAG: hypothetical protein PHD61_01645 [Bacteroidales bacterium]|nr:hypothetical protein [Lentimicrobiaceae bacterium]MDD5693995.1 hypothetical protein [Bacteroidales bacterium]
MEELTLGIGSRIQHPEFGKGVVIQVYADSYEITFMDYGRKQIMKTFRELEVLDYVAPELDLISYEQVERSFIKLIRRLTDIQETVRIGRKWEGGRIILEPGDMNIQNRDMPIDALFHKIVMIRDRIRVMEQKINSSAIPEVDKIELQQYITRIYGTLTSFNLLFAEKDDYFVGEKSK